MLNKIIAYSFYALFFLTPLFWTSLNHELFEYNKMILVYGLTVVIVGAWILKGIAERQFILKRTPLDTPLMLFLAANILSTIFSIDPHTSIWGYYSRSNGGLLSLITYTLLFYAFVSNMDFGKLKKALLAGLASGFLISLWAIFEHFGVSPSCVILRGEFNASCWIQDVQARVFATLGQPNWLAAYLAMLIFPALYFLFTAADKWSRTTYYLLLTTCYLAFTFTYSRGPTLGLIGGFAVFIAFYFRENLIKLWQRGVAGPRAILIVLATFLIINLLFGSALTSFRLISKFAAPVRPGISLPSSVGTQLENGGTESGQIRFIVWKGALDIFKNYPIFGSGLETFAYAYYQYRPVEHNLTSEWDFLYNKAHNEYLNYLATTGIVGFGTYILLIGSFIWWNIKQFKIQNSKFKITNQNLKLNKKLSETTTTTFDFSFLTFNFALLAAYISYLIYNFFLFSVVIIAVFFYLFPAMAFVAARSFPRDGRGQDDNLRLEILRKLSTFIYRRPFYTKAAKGLVIAAAIYLLYSISQIWLADTMYAKGERASDSGNPGRAYNYLTIASQLNPGEPLFRSELSYAAGAAAASLKDTDASLSAALREQAEILTGQVLRENPKNISYLRTAVRTYFELSAVDETYLDKTLKSLEQSIKLAPTDPKLYYNKALILQAMNKKEEEIKTLEEAIRLKPNYNEALEALREATASGR